MKLEYYPDTKSLYIELAPGTSVESEEIVDGVVADFSSSGDLIGLDIEDTSKFDLSKLEAVNFTAPLTAKTA